jgi:hypothetical protein
MHGGHDLKNSNVAKSIIKTSPQYKFNLIIELLCFYIYP